MYTCFDSWFEEVKEVADECGKYIDNASDFEHFYKQGLSPDDAYNQWILEEGNE
ncbi:hypothetical protein vB_AbaM_Acibel004_39 [Acinetobacter phage vB_AbaM_Acibel004]|uniref:hypothetical protein n=1 Tax=Acinetobacter phage vB_AbaM_Acibel004 TaxID=1481186 RepID=UPI0004E84ED2|nr:hypothetical protein vB_AbaM_Acibel004_39 [Acinetobacter phage vB_AbaM_Acibel004]AHY26654.1 hypothetical protein vB_AbaM_Acibel004_39 [Acinetobacter phage vB_AbaM_Acibel004]